MKTLLIALLLLSLQGCWFVIIPGSLIRDVGNALRPTEQAPVDNGK